MSSFKNKITSYVYFENKAFFLQFLFMLYEQPNFDGNNNVIIISCVFWHSITSQWHIPLLFGSTQTTAHQQLLSRESASDHCPLHQDS